MGAAMNDDDILSDVQPDPEPEPPKEQAPPRPAIPAPASVPPQPVWDGQDSSFPQFIKDDMVWKERYANS